MDEYACVSKSSLKLKCSGIKKKKKKSKDGREKVEVQAQLQAVARSSEPSSSSSSSVPAPPESGIVLTKAEKSFLQMQEKRQTARILEKASKSHKKRVEEFNNHLDSLSEHYDIPKVSWTK